MLCKSIAHDTRIKPVSGAPIWASLSASAAGPADVLGGSFDLASVNDFTLSGWGAVEGLAAGDHVDTLALSYLAGQLGAYEDSIVFNGFGTNASDPQGLAQTRRLIIRANVIDPNGNPVPEPGSLALMLAAAVAGLVAKRRRPAPRALTFTLTFTLTGATP